DRRRPVHLRLLPASTAVPGRRRRRPGAAPVPRCGRRVADGRSLGHLSAGRCAMHPGVDASRQAAPTGEAPYYVPSGDEIAIFERCHAGDLAVMLKGPTGCGKTRFVEYMAWRLQRPLVTISCHDDLSASDLIGRFLVRHDGTAWNDGPLTRAVREGAICYLDEVVEARQDTVVVLHPLTDHRRILPIDKT